MCRAKTPIEALGLDRPVLTQLSRWMGNAHTIGQLQGINVETLVAARFEESDAERIVSEVQSRLG